MNMFPFLLNKIGKIDTIFFLSILAIILIIVGIYFLIPVFNKKQYAEQRENLRKREKSFKANLQHSEEPMVVEADTTGEPQKETEEVIVESTDE